MAIKRLIARGYRRKRIRQKVVGTSERPRLSIFKSASHFHAQLIDDFSGKTILGVSTLSKEFKDKKDSGNVKGAVNLGKLFAKKALAKKIINVVFDRGGFLYHGRVKAFADAVREGGLKF